VPGRLWKLTTHPVVMVSAVIAVVALSAVLSRQRPAAAPAVGRVSAPVQPQAAPANKPPRPQRFQPSDHAVEVVKDHWVRLPRGPADGRAFSIELWTGRE
jgi:hypothetical protein